MGVVVGGHEDGGGHDEGPAAGADPRVGVGAGVSGEALAEDPAALGVERQPGGGEVGSRVPGREVADGALVIVGGTLLLTPGFLSDVLGLLCVLPPTRALLRRSLTGFVARRLLRPAARRPGRVVDELAVEVPRPRTPTDAEIDALRERALEALR